FMNLSHSQAKEIAKILSDMIDLLAEAEAAFDAAGHEWASKQAVPTRWMRIFFTTWRNLFFFHADAPVDHLTDDQRHWIADEIANPRLAIEHIDRPPRSPLPATRSSWQQCFGLDLVEDLRLKLEFMKAFVDATRPTPSGRVNEGGESLFRLRERRGA